MRLDEPSTPSVSFAAPGTRACDGKCESACSEKRSFGTCNACWPVTKVDPSCGGICPLPASWRPHISIAVNSSEVLVLCQSWAVSSWFGAGVELCGGATIKTSAGTRDPVHSNVPRSGLCAHAHALVYGTQRGACVQSRTCQICIHAHVSQALTGATRMLRVCTKTVEVEGSVESALLRLLTNQTRQ